MKMLKTRANSTMGPFEISIKAPIFNHAQMDYSWIYATLIDETTALKLYSQSNIISHSLTTTLSVSRWGCNVYCFL